MSVDDFDDLIDAALTMKSARVQGSFIMNEAGAELQRRGHEILPKLEATLRDLVAPRFISAHSNEFLGLSHVLGAYLLIGSKHCASSMVAFLDTLPLRLQAEAISKVPQWFGFLSSDRSRPPVAVPVELLEFISKSTHSTLPSLCKTAGWAVSVVKDGRAR